MALLKAISWIPVIFIWTIFILIIAGVPNYLQQHPAPLQLFYFITLEGGLFLLYQLFKDRINFQIPFIVYMTGFMLCWAFGSH